jgi:hypothetical protein
MLRSFSGVYPFSTHKPKIKAYENNVLQHSGSAGRSLLEYTGGTRISTTTLMIGSLAPKPYNEQQ